MKLVTSLLFCLVITTHLSFAQEADLVLFNGNVNTVDSSNTRAEAVAIKDGSFIFVGANDGVAIHVGNNTQRFNLMGKEVLPGLIDTHTHPLEAGSPLTACVLNDHIEDIENHFFKLRRCSMFQIGTNIDPVSGLEWVIGYGVTIDQIDSASRDLKDILDEAIPNNPAIVLEQTSHGAWVNSAALRAAGFNASSENPEGGVIVKDEVTDEPTGLLLDNAVIEVFSLAFNRDSRELPTLFSNRDDLDYYGLLLSLDKFVKNGVTALADARTYWERLHHESWFRADQEGTLPVRSVLGFWGAPENNDLDQLASINTIVTNINNNKSANSLLYPHQIKVYSDGLLTYTTAALTSPYEVDFGFGGIENKGINYYDEDRLESFISFAEKEGFDFHIHTIGDRGVHEALNAIEGVQAINTMLDKMPRHKLTHVELVQKSDIPRFAKLGVGADFQLSTDFSLPSHFDSEKELIGSRADGLYPIDQFYKYNLDNPSMQINITLSSDYDVGALNPFGGLKRAVLRGIPLQEAIRYYTINGAYQLELENEVGSIEVGKKADLVVVNKKDISKLPAERLDKVRVLLTLVDGKAAYKTRRFKKIPGFQNQLNKKTINRLIDETYNELLFNEYNFIEL